MSSISALSISNHYSPHNKDRPQRASTEFIILHTTEAQLKSSKRKLHERGECHYLVAEDGQVYRIMRKDLVAYHCGKSMWDAKENLDARAIGIEVVGYHDRSITGAQKAALKELVSQLQSAYKVPDSKVLTHSMVAYGKPNRWHPYRHRGRKRCGMLFASPQLRGELGLKDQPRFDPDVKAGRLKNADPELAGILYGQAPALPASHDHDSHARMQIHRISKGRTAWDIARDAYNREDTLYMFPDGKAQTGDRIRKWNNVPLGTKVITGLEAVGQLSAGTSPFKLVGKDWNQQTTYYLFPDGRIDKGTNIDPSDLPRGTRVFVQHL